MNTDEIYVKYLSIVCMSRVFVMTLKCCKNMVVPMPWDKAHS